jgi:hypothetical protein
MITLRYTTMESSWLGLRQDIEKEEKKMMMMNT